MSGKKKDLYFYPLFLKQNHICDRNLKKKNNQKSVFLVNQSSIKHVYHIIHMLIICIPGVCVNEMTSGVKG